MLTLFRDKGIGNWELGIGKGPANSEFLISNSRSGFTLLEILVAVAILGSALAVILAAVNRNLVLASESKNLTVAGALIQAKIAEIELEEFPEPREEKGEFAEAPGFEWSLSITPLRLPGLGTEIRVVRLSVTWDDGKKDFEVTLAMSRFK